MIYVIWFMCVWTRIIVSTNMVMHDKAFNDQPPNLKLFVDAPPHSLKGSNVNWKVKTTKEEGVGVCSLAYDTLGVKGCVGAPGWGFGRMTNKLIIHTDLHKPNNKLVSV